MPHLHILTLTWNACDKLTKLKESLLPNLNDVPFTWFIKDNDSKDNTYDVSSAWDQNIKSFKYANNRQNFSQGVNYLFHQASPNDNDYVMLLNNDVVFNDTTSIKEMIKIMRDPEVGIVGARLLFPNSNRLQHAGVIFEAPHNLPMHYRINQESDAQSEKNRLFQVVTGAVLLMRAGDFRQVHKNDNGIVGMDEKFHWAFDDVDLCLSVGCKLNKKVVYCGKTNISHESSASLKKNPSNKLFMNHNVNYLLTKWGKQYKVDKEFYIKQPNYNLYNGGKNA